MFKVALSQEKHKSIVRSEKVIEIDAIWGFLQSQSHFALISTDFHLLVFTIDAESES